VCSRQLIRFIRHNAQTYKIDPTEIGALGDSSGGHLVNMLGTLDGKNNPDDPNMINRESAKVQVVVALFAPSDFVSFARGLDGARDYVSSFLGVPYPLRPGGDPGAAQLYRDASPITYVSPDDPPFLLIHGDADPVVPFRQSELFRDALAKSGVEVELIKVIGGGHGADLLEGSNAQEVFEPMVKWFDRKLRSKH
jgi:dipeptidyl aminopeptidase/acylaminoacyl peptidase